MRINLTQDFNKTHLKREPNSYHSERSACERRTESAATKSKVDKCDITVNKPAEISFSGFSCAKDLESVEGLSLKRLINATKSFIKNDKSIDSSNSKEVHKATKSLIEKAIDFVHNPEAEAVDDSVKKFFETESNHENVKTLLDDAKSVIKSSDKEINYSSPEYKSAVKKYVNEAVDILHSVENPSWIYKNKGVKKFLMNAEKSQAVFSALFAAGLACVLRPITIVSVPSKKNKEDQKYAAAHSIASGFIGYIFALIVSSPIAKAVDKIANNPENILGKEKTDFFENLNDEKKAERLLKEAENGAKDVIKIGETKRFSIARSYMNMIPEIVTAVPKAIITISLISPILKYVFGLEKKSHKNNEAMPISQNYAAINFRSINSSKKKVFQNFMGGN